MRRRGFTPGFTLIEVLVALAIVTIGMAAVLGALTSSAGTISYLRDKTFAQWVALNRISTLRLSGQQTAVGNSDGDIDFAGRTWHWRQEVVATQIPGVVRIDIKVRPKDAPGDDDKGWFTTVSGIQGDAVGTPNGYQPDWGSQMLAGQGVPGQRTLGSGLSGTQGLGSGTPGAPGGLGSPGAFGQPSIGSGGIGVQGGTLGAPDTLGTPQNPTPPPGDPDTTPDSSQ